MLLTLVPGDASSLLSGSTAVTISSARLISSLSTSRPRLRASRRDAARVAFVRLGRAFPPALPTLARVRLQRLSPIGNRRNPPPRAENAANFFRSSGEPGQWAGEGDARSSAELAVEHVSWSKVCPVAALANTGPG